MRVIGLVFGLSVLLVEGLLICRGVKCRTFKFLPLFFAYLIYDFSATGFTYLVYWLRPSAHASVYWLCYVLSIIAEFAVLAEISDHIFQPYPSLRNLGRALTLVVSGIFGIFYVLPTLLSPQAMRPALLGFALRTSLTKAALLIALFLAVRHFGLKLGRNIAGLMLGFSIYQGVNVANLAAASTFAPNLYAGMLWVLAPATYLLCLLVWTVALWQIEPLPTASSARPALGQDSETAAFGLTRFNNILSRFLHK